MSTFLEEPAFKIKKPATYLIWRHYSKGQAQFLRANIIHSMQPLLASSYNPPIPHSFIQNHHIPLQSYLTELDFPYCTLKAQCKQTNASLTPGPHFWPCWVNASGMLKFNQELALPIMTQGSKTLPSHRFFHQQHGRASLDYVPNTSLSQADKQEEWKYHGIKKRG